MPRSTKLRWTGRTVAIPLLLSLTVHGLLFLALWFWPTRTRSPTLTIQSTRILLNTCVVDSPSAMLLAERELPFDLRGPGVDVDPALAPRLEANSSPLIQKRSVPVPTSGSSNENRKEKGKEGENRNGYGKECQSGGSLFPVPAVARSVVYVLDHSLSMGTDRKLDSARRELITSLRQLPKTVRFQVIDYNDSVEMLIVDGRMDLLPAEPAIVTKAISHLQTLYAAGKSNHVAALRCGVNLHPDLLYFLTDAGDLKPEDIAIITRCNQRTAIHTIELTRRRTLQPDHPLSQLVRDNGGTYRRVWLGD
jgi:hypothetical protein